MSYETLYKQIEAGNVLMVWQSDRGQIMAEMSVDSKWIFYGGPQLTITAAIDSLAEVLQELDDEPE